MQCGECDDDLKSDPCGEKCAVVWSGECDGDLKSDPCGESVGVWSGECAVTYSVCNGVATLINTYYFIRNYIST